MALVTETVTINSKQFKHIYSNGGYYVLDPDGKQYVDVYEPSGSTKTFTETTIVVPQTVTQRYFENRLLTKCDLDLSNSTRPHIIETYSSGTEWYRVFSDKFCIQGNVYSTAIGNDRDVTITLKKPYKNGNYIVCDNGYQTASGADWGAGSLSIVSKSTTSFVLTNDGMSGCKGLNWIAYGYV